MAKLIQEHNRAAQNGSKNASGNLRPSELSVFCYQIALVLKSGIPLVEGIKLLSDEMADNRLKSAAQEICQDIKKGVQFHIALEKHPVFPTYMVSMIQIGEVSGSLDNVMEYLSSYYDKVDKLNRRIKSAVTYPLLLMGLMAGVILLLIFKILPMFNDILSSIGGEMPTVTRAMMNISIYMKSYLFAFLLVVLAAAVVAYAYLRTSKGKFAFDKFKVDFNLTKNVFQKISVAQFSMGMALLLKSGVGFEEALGLVTNIVGNSYIASKIEECKSMIKNGVDATQALSDINIFPKLFTRIVNIGYKTGELDNAMSKVAAIYESEVENSLLKLTAAIEPILVIVLSMVVGFILLTVMLPLINIMSSIG